MKIAGGGILLPGSNSYGLAIALCPDPAPKLRFLQRMWDVVDGALLNARPDSSHGARSPHDRALRQVPDEVDSIDCPTCGKITQVSGVIPFFC